jgi:hypothetical protein
MRVRRSCAAAACAAGCLAACRPPASPREKAPRPLKRPTCISLMRRCVPSAPARSAARRCAAASRRHSSSLRLASCGGRGAWARRRRLALPRQASSRGACPLAAGRSPRKALPRVPRTSAAASSALSCSSMSASSWPIFCALRPPYSWSSRRYWCCGAAGEEGAAGRRRVRRGRGWGRAEGGIMAESPAASQALRGAVCCLEGQKSGATAVETARCSDGPRSPPFPPHPPPPTISWV